jgi:hypothetical protein
MEQLLRQPDSDYKSARLEELVNGMSPLQQARLGAAINTISEVDSTWSTELAKAKDHHQAMSAEQEARVAALRAQSDQTFESILNAASDPKEGDPVYQNRDGDDAWNKEVEERVSMAKAVYNGKAPQESIFKIILAGVAAPAFFRQMDAQAKEIESLKAQIGKFKATSPSPQSQRAEGQGQAERFRPKQGTSPREWTQNWVKTMEAAMNGGQ